MITFKQMEALYWIAELGGFAAAANRLNTTQSAVSKRIQEMETAFSIEIFDRSRRTARLTEKGEELLMMARDLLERRELILERMSDPAVLARRFRLGVTELTAMTWLPALIDAIRTAYPRLVIEPSVDLSTALFDGLVNDKFDLIVVPDVFDDARCVVTPLKSVENAWMCTPALADSILGPKPETPLPLAGISDFVVLSQGEMSGTGIIYDRWLHQIGVRPSRSIVSNNLLAQIGLTLSGMGITYLPVETVRPLLRLGLLKVVETRPRLPRVRYAALYREERTSRLCSDVVTLAAGLCSFASPLLAGAR